MARPVAGELLLFLAVFLLFTLSEPLRTVDARDEEVAVVKGMFVFGSSLVDNGNNNYLKNSSAKADYSPYGIDFPLGPSGRFSNGRNSIDALGELLRFPGFIPPFADPRTAGGRILHGVDFASGGSGILDQTGSLAGEVVSLNKQIRNFEMRTLPDLEQQLRARRGVRFSNDYLSEYLFVVGAGGNDYLLNYFVPTRERKPSLSRFTEVLVSTLTRQLQKLYSLGARKFVLFSIQPMGCIPVARANLQISNGSCIESLNEAALLFNNLLKAKTMVTLKPKIPRANIVFINSYNIIRAIIDDPRAHGFLDASRACCELSSEKGESILCKRGGITCENRRNYVFFDGLHPTDAVNLKIAQKAYGSNLLEEAYPFNVRKLAHSM
ncbi:GDSL esterase/lipase [Platanthera guangdongensis]|uniref:GDSL esterase/lipase n=1 Tax=Platanthera guangdongensis TaxID=2320717 RepID=A0ABR2LF34_9ASPA